MNFFYLDASAFGKRYTLEQGTLLINRLFGGVARTRLMVLDLGLGEVLSIIVRRHNAGRLSDQRFAQVSAQLRAETLNAGDFRLEAVNQGLIRASLALIERHSINATDALVLRSALNVAADLRAHGDDVILVAADARLVRAAQAEGLATFNPETDTAAQLRALLA